MRTLTQFITSPARNEWIHETINGTEYAIYVRKSSRWLYDTPLPETRPTIDTLKHVLDLASVETDTPGSGQFRLLLDMFETAASDNRFHAVYIESVLNRRLGAYITRRGYTRHGTCDCFYRTTSSAPLITQ